MNAEKLQRMAGSVRTGGKGSVRRKKKAVHKATSTDDRRLQATFKRLGVSNIPGIDEVMILSGDGTVLIFSNPKVQASIQANTYVVSGVATQKRARDLLSTGGLAGVMRGMHPGMMPPGMMPPGMMAGVASMMGGAGAGGFATGTDAGGHGRGPAVVEEEGEEEEEEDDDDDVPELVENFDQAAT